jgi:hypothetical protein
MKKEHKDNFNRNLLRDFRNAQKPLSRESVLEIGFKEMPHFTVGGNLIFDLGRRRSLSISSIGTPNEMLYIVELQEDSDKTISDLICLHNYDYDGFLKLRKLKSLITGITGIAFMRE